MDITFENKPNDLTSSPISESLLQKFDVSGPRYTSYPTADRFVEAFVQGKSRIKQWGAQRIKSGLISHHIPETVINRALSSLSKTENHAYLRRWLEKKQSSLKNEAEGPKKRAKVIRFLLSKGFALDEILKEV